MGRKKKDPLSYTEHFEVETANQAAECIAMLCYKGYKMNEIFSRIIYDEFGSWYREITVSPVNRSAATL